MQDIISIKRVMQEIEEQHRAEAKAQPAPAPAAPAGPTPQMAVNANPVYQQLKVSYAEAEARVASLQARVAEYDSRYKVLREKAKMAPEIEAQYAQLNRDYAIFKKNYEALVARRESAELSGEMEAAGGVDFRLIDPPRVSPRPVAPNRVALLALALVGAIGAGLAVSFLASQVWPTFFDTRALREATGLPVLGTVSYIIGDAVRRKERRRLAMFVGTCVLFVGCYGAGLLLLFLQTTAA